MIFNATCAIVRIYAVARGERPQCLGAAAELIANAWGVDVETVAITTVQRKVAEVAAFSLFAVIGSYRFIGILCVLAGGPGRRLHGTNVAGGRKC